MSEPARILAIDDSLTIRKALEMILVPEGYTVDLAASGAEGIDKARETRPSMILLDFVLPDMRGSDVCRVLATDPLTRDVPVVLISARGAEIRQAYLDAENVLEYLVKPFTPEDVYSVVRSVLESRPEATAPEVVAEIPTIELREEAPVLAAPTNIEAVAEEMVASPPPSEPVVEPTPPVYTPAPPVYVQTPPAYEPAAPIAAAPWDDAGADAEADLEVEAPIFSGEQDSLRRSTIDAMFETLRAGLEGVYVEEMDTPSGAITNPARSFTELSALMPQQLGETWHHAMSGHRFALGGDGSVRSLDDALLDAHRRICRLLFRAVGAGVVDTQAAAATQPRVLVISGRGGIPDPELAQLSDESGCEVFHISADFAQIAIMARCFGPSHIVVDVKNDRARRELARLQKAGDSRRTQILGFVDQRDGAENLDLESLAEAGISRVFADSSTVLDELRAAIFPVERRGSADREIPTARTLEMGMVGSQPAL